MISPPHGQRRAQAVPGSLLRLRASARGLDHTAKFVDSIVRAAFAVPGAASNAVPLADFPRMMGPAESTARLLNSLLCGLRKLHCSTSSRQSATGALKAMSVHLLLKSLRPSVDFVDELLSYGQLEDPNEEFVLGKSDAMWSDGFCFRGGSAESELVPAVLASAAHAILSGGNSASLLHRCNGADADRRFELLSIYDACVSSFSSASSPSQDATPFSLAWRVSFVVPLVQRCKAVDQLLVNRCMMTYRLMDVLGALRGIFFMGSGRIMDEFCGFCFQKVRQKQHWHDFHVLDALKSVLDEFPEGLCIQQLHMDIGQVHVLDITIIWRFFPTVRVPNGCVLQDSGTAIQQLDDIRIEFELGEPHPVSFWHQQNADRHHRPLGDSGCAFVSLHRVASEHHSPQGLRWKLQPDFRPAAKSECKTSVGAELPMCKKVFLNRRSCTCR